QAAAGPGQLRLPVAGGQIKRLRAKFHLQKETLQALPASEDRGAAKSANVAEAKLVAPLIEDEHQVRVRAKGVERGLYRQLAGHAQMNYQVCLVVEIDNDPFPAPSDIGHAPAAQESIPFLQPGLAQGIPEIGRAH